MTISLQLGFTDYKQTYAKKKTRRQIFLDTACVLQAHHQMPAWIPEGLLPRH